MNITNTPSGDVYRLSDIAAEHASRYRQRPPCSLRSKQHIRGTAGRIKDAGQVQKKFVRTSKGNIELVNVQLEGKKPMQIDQFINGNQEFKNTQLN